jgi:hypothetical protein
MILFYDLYDIWMKYDFIVFHLRLSEDNLCVCTLHCDITCSFTRIDKHTQQYASWYESDWMFCLEMIL